MRLVFPEQNRFPVGDGVTTYLFIVWLIINSIRRSDLRKWTTWLNLGNLSYRENPVRMTMLLRSLKNRRSIKTDVIESYKDDYARLYGRY